MRDRLERIAGSRLTNEGVLVIIAQRHRTQVRNREDAQNRLVEMIRQAAIAAGETPSDTADQGVPGTAD